MFDPNFLPASLMLVAQNISVKANAIAQDTHIRDMYMSFKSLRRAQIFNENKEPYAEEIV